MIQSRRDAHHGRYERDRCDEGHGPRIARRRRAACGFTMIEVLVALVIVAIALAAAIRAVGGLASNENELHQRLLASWSADNELARLKLEQTWPPLGSRSFDCSQANLALTCVVQVSATPNPIFRRVEVSVRGATGRGNLAQMVTVVPNETDRPL